MGRAWHGRAVARGRVASGRAESCKCTVLRVEKIVPLARERSHVILVRHIPAEFTRMGRPQKRGPASPTAVLGRGDHSEVPDFPEMFREYFFFSVVLALTPTSAGNRRPL